MKVESLPDVIKAILTHCSLWESRSDRAPPEVDELVPELDAAYSGNSIDTPDAFEECPRADLRQYQRVSDEILIICTHIFRIFQSQTRYVCIHICMCQIL